MQHFIVLDKEVLAIIANKMHLVLVCIKLGNKVTPHSAFPSLLLTCFLAFTNSLSGIYYLKHSVQHLLRYFNQKFNRHISIVI